MQFTPDQAQNDTSESSKRMPQESGGRHSSSLIPSVAFSPPHYALSSHTNDSFAQHLDIESLLQQDERNRSTSSDNDNDDNNTAISSLPPFGDGMRRSSFDFSSIGSSLGNLIDSNISIEDDSECGPVPSYPASALAELSTPLKTSSDCIKDPSDKTGVKLTPGSIGRPKEVYIKASNDAKDDPENIPTPGKLSAFMGMSRRHKASDASVGGSSIGSNSLSSIFESMGYFKRNRRPHPSRGLTKRRERGVLYRIITGSPEPRPTSFENEREEILFRQREARMVNLRAFILMLFLVCILISVIELSSFNEGNNLRANKRSIDLKGNKSQSANSNDEIDDGNQNPHAYSSLSIMLAKDGVPKDDGRPLFLHNDENQIVDRSKMIDGNHDMTNSGGKLVSDQFLFAIRNNLSDPNTTPSTNNNKYTPLLWNIPESGNDLIGEVLSSCKSFKIASALDANNPKLAVSKLQVFKLNQKQVINVDLSSSSGIQRAKDLNLVSSNIADIIISPMFEEVVTLFDESHKGRAFTIMRDPIDRVLTLIRYLNHANHPNASEMNTQFIVNNWMVRTLAGKFNTELTTDDLNVAKSVLEQKFVVGLFDEMEDSMKRFESYFDVTFAAQERGVKCRHSTLKQWQSNNKESSELTKSEKKKSSGSTSTSTTTTTSILSLENQNKFDIELYAFAKQLYLRQGHSIFKSMI